MQTVTYQDLITFLKQPYPSEMIIVDNGIAVIRIAAKSLLIILGGALLTAGVVAPLRYFHLMPPPESIQPKPWEIAYVLFFGPIIEEMLFRLPLKISRVNLLIPFSIITFILVGYFEKVLSYFIFFFYIGTILYLSHKQDHFFEKFKVFFVRNFKLIFYSQAVIFGFSHLSNFDLDYSYFYLFPFYVIYHIFLGCVLGYIRMRYSHGMVICILTHILVNSVALVLQSL